MSYRISILDKSPLAAGETAAQALTRTLTLAQQAEAWGYHRFWIAEHHNTDQLASPSPEVVIAWILGQTRQIRVGSGGVMLQHYSPYKVAENFNLLASIAPGRVDLASEKRRAACRWQRGRCSRGLIRRRRGLLPIASPSWITGCRSPMPQGKRTCAPRQSRRVAPTASCSAPAGERSARRPAGLEFRFRRPP